MIQLRNAVDTEEFLNNENSEKVINIAEEILNFDKQQKGKRLPFNIDDTHLKILSPKVMLQRLAIAIPQVQAGNTSENVLNVIRQIV